MSEIENCASVVRNAAQDGLATELILDRIIGCLGEQMGPFTFTAVLWEAFGIPVRTLRDVESWDKASEGGDMTTSEVVSILRPWIEGSRADP
jgi:hypothetical protein